MGTPLARGVPYIETTWAQWRQLHPDTRVLSSETGHQRNYNLYPYGDYRQDDDNTFSRTNPTPDPAFPGKHMTTGLIAGGVARAYVHEEIAEQTKQRRGTLDDEIAGMPIVIVYDVDHTLLVAFHRGVPGVELRLQWSEAP